LQRAFIKLRKKWLNVSANPSASYDSRSLREASGDLDTQLFENAPNALFYALKEENVDLFTYQLDMIEDFMERNDKGNNILHILGIIT
jgi:hypothetical protein